MAGSHPDRARDIADWGSALLRAFGEVGTPAKAAFILPDGRLVKYHESTHTQMAATVAPPGACRNYSENRHPGCLRALITETGAIKIHNWAAMAESYDSAGGELVIVMPRFRKITPAQSKQLAKFLSPRAEDSHVTVTLLGSKSQGSRHCNIEPALPGRRKMAFLACLRENDIARPAAGFDGAGPRRSRKR